jgi:hypothetical protein
VFQNHCASYGLLEKFPIRYLFPAVFKYEYAGRKNKNYGKNEGKPKK